MKRIRKFSSSLKEEVSSNVKKDIKEKIYDVYRAKDYWDFESVINGKIQQWKYMGEPEPWTEAKIRDAMELQEEAQKMQWLISTYERFLDKDEEDIKSVVRLGQIVMIDLFCLATGTDRKNLKTAPGIKQAIENWCRG